MKPLRNRVYGDDISDASRAEKVFGGLLRISQGISKTLFLPFFRYGFGERYLTYRKGLGAIFFILFLSWINYTVTFFDPVEFFSSSFAKDKSLTDFNKEIDENINLLPLSPKEKKLEKKKFKSWQSPEEKKLEKEKFKFRIRYLTWYVFAGIYFSVITRHRLKFKGRLAADGYDYTRHSLFPGDSYTFMFLITEKVRDVWLVLVAEVKKLWDILQKFLSVRIDLTKKKVSKAIVRADKNAPLSATDEMQNDKAQDQNKAIRPESPQDRIDPIDIKVPYKVHLLDHKILICVVEPGLVILLGILQLFFNQAFGTFCIVVGISHMLIEFTDYGLIRHGALDKIDALFNVLAEKGELEDNKDALAKAGHAFHAPIPTEAEILDNLAPNLHRKKERFVVT